MTYKELRAHTIGGFHFQMTPEELALILYKMDRHEDTVDADCWELILWEIRN